VSENDEAGIQAAKGMVVSGSSAESTISGTESAIADIIKGSGVKGEITQIDETKTTTSKGTAKNLFPTIGSSVFREGNKDTGFVPWGESEQPTITFGKGETASTTEKKEIEIDSALAKVLGLDGTENNKTIDDFLDSMNADNWKEKVLDVSKASFTQSDIMHGSGDIARANKAAIEASAQALSNAVENAGTENSGSTKSPTSKDTDSASKDKDTTTKDKDTTTKDKDTTTKKEKEKEEEPEEEEVEEEKYKSPQKTDKITADVVEDLETVVDRFANINNALDGIEKRLDKVANKKDRAFGSKYSDAIAEENKLLSE